jgi:hypothetical protein
MSQDDLLLEMKKRAVANAYSRNMLPAQIGGACCILLWPLGAAMGVFGIAGVVSLGVGSAIAGFSAAEQDKKRISDNDVEFIQKSLTELDIEEFSAKKAALAQGASEPKKLMGAAQEIPPNPDTRSIQSNPIPENGRAATLAGRGESTVEGSGQKGEILTSKAPTWPDGEHLFMVGLSGGAKTTVLQGITAQTSDPVVYLTIKSDDKAPPTWNAYRLEKFAGEKLLQQLLWLLDTLESWVKNGVKHRLVIDEYVSLQDAAKSACKMMSQGHELKGIADRLENLVKTYIRTGRSDGHYIGLLSQTPNGTDNFGSAKTQQGLRVFLCASEKSSEKFRFLVPWSKQMFSDLITPEIEAQLRGIKSGFWHLFADEGMLFLNPTQKPTLEQVPCQECPTWLSGDKDIKAGNEPESKSLDARILEYMNRHGEAKTAREIRNACTRPTDNPRASTDEVKDILCMMISEGQIQRWEDGKSERYQATGTV